MVVALSETEVPKWRSVVAAIGLGVAVVSASLYAGLATTYAISDAGFRTHFVTLFWYRVAYGSGILAIVATSLGRGRLRKWGLVVAIPAFVLWLFSGHR